MLYLVSTPIGNLKDVSERAREVLETADLIACEDTRTSAGLFSLLGIKHGPLTPYHEFNADEARPALIQKLQKGVNIALVSDAGTPLVSDPGYRLVRECRQKNIEVTTVPGANAVLSALQLSGLPSDHFYFHGFLPPKQSGRRQALNEVKNISATMIFYETANRLQETLADIDFVLGNRQVAVVREITKKFEETKVDAVQNLIAFYAENGAPKGEIVLVVDRLSDAQKTPDADTIDQMILECLQTLSVKDTAERLAMMTGLNKKQIYKRALELKE